MAQASKPFWYAKPEVPLLAYAKEHFASSTYVTEDFELASCNAHLTLQELDHRLASRGSSEEIHLALEVVVSPPAVQA